MKATSKLVKGKIFLKISGSILLPVLALFVVLMISLSMMATILSAVQSSSEPPGGAFNLPEAVEGYRIHMQEACDKYGASDFCSLLLAIMACESGGITTDPMNVSVNPFNLEYEQVPQGIKDPLYSIDTAVRYFVHLKNLAGLEALSETNKVYLAIQAYNFGQEYIPWAMQHADGGYSQQNASEYANNKAAELNVPSYGNPNYVQAVLSFWQAAYANGSVTGSGIFIWPVPGEFNLSRGFGVQASGYWHRGLDITSGSINGKPIIAADSGTVITAVYSSEGYGVHIQIDHGNGYISTYAHCVSLDAYVGQIVSAGQTIAFVGSTGNSTGPHLHFDILKNGVYIDPFTVL